MENLRPKSERLLKIICKHFDIDYSDFLDNIQSRKRKYKQIRHYYYAIKVNNHLEFESLQKTALGTQDHATVLNAVKRINEGREIYNDMLSEYNLLSSFCLNPRYKIPNCYHFMYDRFTKKV